MARPIVIHADWDAEAGVWSRKPAIARPLSRGRDDRSAPRDGRSHLLEEYGISDLPASIESVSALTPPNRDFIAIYPKTTIGDEGEKEF